MNYIYETTPYGVKQIGDKFVVRQFAFGKDVSDVFDTRDLAEQESINLARTNGCLVKVRIK
jgi:hypothetical protein